MREIEVKILEVDKDAVIEKLKALGAKKTFEGKLENYYFDLPDKLFSNNKTVLRLRRQKNQSILCLKQSISNIGAKQMHEHETPVDYAKTKKLLTELGFEIIESLEKRRETWVIGKIHFDFDRYIGSKKKIPEFLEIEVPDTRQLFSIAKKLGFSKKDLKPWGANKLLRYYGIKR
ncbi:MAG: class IV adenylate cyclase [Candidatus Diapherotrites archaeon]|uniref:Class IV adenylate cyclase n=1 Tax=Candidatus Iainarchaeum sp. TaxID=3101447 RepID=A0A8T4L516_9ARCH|nr:class IV adenylate cyclase [Candidatus Diapherotrites archaeon]